MRGSRSVLQVQGGGIAVQTPCRGIVGDYLHLALTKVRVVRERCRIVVQRQLGVETAVVGYWRTERPGGAEPDQAGGRDRCACRCSQCERRTRDLVTARRSADRGDVAV